MSTTDECFCWQELEALNQKFDESVVECITDRAKFRIVGLDTDMLNSALVAIYVVVVTLIKFTPKWTNLK